MGGAVLVGMVQWAIFSPHFGDAISKMQVVPGRKRKLSDAAPGDAAAGVTGSSMIGSRASKSGGNAGASAPVIPGGDSGAQKLSNAAIVMSPQAGEGH